MFQFDAKPEICWNMSMISMFYIIIHDGTVLRLLREQSEFTLPNNIIYGMDMNIECIHSWSRIVRF